MYDVIVVGAGHAGIEAALASARRNKNTALITLKIDQIGKMPCNPSIGGPAKGVVVREIDALGGQMGITADKTALQFKMLNTTKGPGVQCLRVQSDKIEYSKMMQEVCQNQNNLTVIEDQVVKVNIQNNKVTGVTVKDGTKLNSKIVILTTGTYMASKIMISSEVTDFGPDNEPTTNKLSESLEDAGLELFRLKTGTPARVLTNSIDFSKTQREEGTDMFISFSDTTKEIRPFDQQIPCHLIYTRPETHKIVMDNITKSSMYSGVVKGVGPRYCPSIEDKLVRFKDKERHQLFLEPESLSMDTIYVQGFSTSLPRDIQEKMYHSLPGLENCVIKKYAYAIEYDAINPLQTKLSLENKKVKNLYTAGQINGTSGYEEAAGQGLMAGINASLKLEGIEPLILRRDEAYIGVMIDDLCTKGTLEPYRLLTSRAEFRLLMRHDNADQRLYKYGHDLGLISEERYLKFENKIEKIKDYKEKLAKQSFSPKSAVNDYLETLEYGRLKDGVNALTLLSRPHLELEKILKYLDFDIDSELVKNVEIEVKYQGYITKALKEAKRMHKMEKTRIPENLDYNDIIHLSIESRQKLIKYTPQTIGQATRISGVNPADIQNVMIYLKQKRGFNNEN
jgi:tRNA uridine 5-carboxymethylaminomethyl modification enzyme